MLGTGLLQGLAVTARNLVGSFHDPARYVTTEYPEQKTAVAENYRNFPFLVGDNPNDPIGSLRCVACTICETECPPQCIYIVMDRDEKGRALKRPKIFDIDISVCMSCQICVEVCPFDAIKMDQQYEIAVADRFHALLLHRESLAKSNDYYRQLHPTEAAAVDQLLSAQKARQAAAKAAKAALLSKGSSSPRTASDAPGSIPAAGGSNVAPPAPPSPPPAPAGEAPKPPPPAA